MKIGERVIELDARSAKSIPKDKVISEAITEIEKLDRNIEELRQKASEISSIAS